MKKAPADTRILHNLGKLQQNLRSLKVFRTEIDEFIFSVDNDKIYAKVHKICQKFKNHEFLCFVVIKYDDK